MFIQTSITTRRLKEGDTIKLVAGGLARVMKVTSIEAVPAGALMTFTIRCSDDAD
jgi:hypothetical protein